MIEYVLFIIYFIIYCSFEGAREAFYYHEATKNSDTIKKNLHPVFAAQRVSVFVMFLTFHANMFILMSAIFMFPFFHDGAYFIERNRLNPKTYIKKFCDHSTTSTAFFEFSFTWRLILFIIGIFIFITTLIYFT